MFFINILLIKYLKKYTHLIKMYIYAKYVELFVFYLIKD